MSLVRLIERLKAERRDLSLLVTTGTVTSAAMIASRLGDRVIHQYVPVDRRAWVERFLDHWRPDAAIWIESEIWPALLRGLRRRGIPAALVNGRMSVRSHRRWARVPATIAALMATFDVCLAQSQDEAERLSRLGAPNARYVGHLKYAADPLPAEPRALDEARTALGERPVWLMASSHPGEEEIAISAHMTLVRTHPGLLTLIVPRHPNRGAAVLGLVERAGLRGSLRSGGRNPSRSDDVYVADTMGEMGIWYRLAPVCCIGGSLVPIGGHNPIEAAQLGSALLLGPHMDSIPEIATELIGSGAALPVSDAETLAATVEHLLTHPEDRQRVVTSAQRIADRNQGVIERVMESLRPLLDRIGVRDAA